MLPIILTNEPHVSPDNYSWSNNKELMCTGGNACETCIFESVRPCHSRVQMILDFYCTNGTRFPHTLDLSLYPELFI